jgi:hypothetical protein
MTSGTVMVPFVQARQPVLLLLRVSLRLRSQVLLLAN